MLGNVIAIFAGLILLRGCLKNVPGIGSSLEKFARWLGQFEFFIGILAVIAGLFDLPALEGVILILAGLILIAGGIGAFPSVGRHLARLGRSLKPFRPIIGLLVLLAGILGMLSFLWHPFGRPAPF
jgi:hypothetical protein